MYVYTSMCALCLLSSQKVTGRERDGDHRRQKVSMTLGILQKRRNQLKYDKALFQYPIAPHLPPEEAPYPCMFVLEHSVLSDGNPVHSTIAGPAWAPPWGTQLQAQREGSVAASFWTSTAVSTPIEGSLCALRACAECF